MQCCYQHDMLLATGGPREESLQLDCPLNLTDILKWPTAPAASMQASATAALFSVSRQEGEDARAYGPCRVCMAWQVKGEIKHLADCQ